MEQDNELTSDEAAAALAFAIELNEGLLPQAQPESPQTQETGATSEETLQPEVDTTKEDNEARFKDLESKIESFKEEVKEMIKDEVSGIKDAIQEALKDDGGQE